MKATSNKYHIHSISELNTISNKVFLVRVDFNIPIDDNGIILDSFRIKNSIPTIDFLLKKNAIVILVSHLGDPKSSQDKLSFSPLIDQIERILDCKVLLLKGDITELGNDMRKYKTDINSRTIFMLDNIRHFQGEKNNDYIFANELIKQLKVDYYVNDAFSVSHRKHASIVAIPSIIEKKFAGLSLLDELDMLESTLGNAFKNHTKITAIIGGKKVATKLLLLQSLAKKVDNLVIVGGMANTFLKAHGIDIGQSFYEPDMLEQSLEIKNYILPVDFVNQDCEITTNITKNMSIYDIGPQSVKLIDTIMNQSDLVLWNGPAGVYEDERFASGSISIAHSIVQHQVKAIIGGGDTASIINKLHITKNIYTSTGGGAFISWLENNNLPGIVAISNKK
jgi:phosphoglycerate kinase